ncbi:ABC transporter ATP-binding protein [Paraclostridium ghonii]|uniref:ATP-binding cassette subfamily B protein n=1 Tax=Paraclostridium ghonii TaxID=29358 RepID=A0ABU0MXH8_9FIRM|nr:ABC transporter ATP-binding protein [Paeniclostridium ghonii]MDQ0555459.1 ATP-binding cassette subfamily B protein [Paeniclostridium ghonii]
MKSKIESRFTPRKKPKNTRKTIGRLLKYFKNEKNMFLLISILVLVDSLIVILIPLLIGKCVDLIDISGIKSSVFKVTLLALLIFYLIDSIVSLFKEFIMINMSQRVIKNIRSSVFSKLQTLPISYFDEHKTGDLMSRVTNDIDNISSGISSSITQIITSSITIIGTVIMMFLLSPSLTILSIITMPLVIILSKFIARRSKVFFKNQQIELGLLNSHIEENIKNMNVIKSFNYEQESIETFNEINDRLLKESLKAQIYSSLLMPMMNVITNIAFALISIAGAYLSIKNIITVGVIATFLSYTKQFTRPLNELANLFNTFQISIAGCERVFEILDEQVKEKYKKEDTKKVNMLKGDIEFKNIWFKYNEGDYILKDLSFKIKKGTSNAIIGTTGSGKTTIINLINRLYEHDKGNILVDGYNINNYEKESFNNAFSIVLQDIYLFNGTILENIKYSKLDAKEDEVIDACKISNSHSFIMKLKNNYDTYIEEGGDSLSIGQKQLISISRAILKNPSILILDEATSSIDTNTERKVQEAIKHAMENRTSIIIAHRLSTIRDCDNIMVIDKGKIAESGTHEYLMNKKGIYYDNICSLKGENVQ